MKRTEVNDILKATGGSLISQGTSNFITDIKQDSRECKAGDMFVAVIGERLNGHAFVPQVIEAGCDTVLVSERDWMESTDCSGVNVILVDDTVRALGDLASWYLDTLGIRKIAVTGSVGKTSTRDMSYYVLSEKFNCGRNLKNFNNEIGLPLSIFQFDETTEVAVLEMGMDHFGEISRLGEIVHPDIAVITNIGVAHLENLGSQEGIFKAKMEVTEHLAGRASGGTLIYPADGVFLTKERTAGDYDQVEIGTDGRSDYIVTEIDDFGLEGIEFTLECDRECRRIKLPVPGVHNAINASVAIAAGRLLGVSVDEACNGLSKVSLTGSRLKKVRGRSVTIIDDTYNANPDSMKGALKVLEKSKASGKKIAVLGDMFELGSDEKKQHYGVGVFARGCGIDRLVAIGDLAREIADGARGLDCSYYETKEEFFRDVKDIVKPGDVILVKASRGMAMEEVVEKLKEI